ncbi:hypothetical protein ACHAXT_012521 [Thalassiosira profunda]
MVPYRRDAAALALGFAALLETGSASPACDPCIDRSEVKIGVVHHGQPSTDVYWEKMNVAIKQGAKDMSIDLHFDADQNEGMTQEEIHDKMAMQIEQYCVGDGVHGLLVSLPDDDIAEALAPCTRRGVQIATFNAGPNHAKEYDLIYFGQNETNSGMSAGDALAKVEGTSTFCCSNHASWTGVLAERCGGMEAGVEANSKGGSFNVAVDPNNCTSWRESILAECSPGDGIGWSSVGLYLAGKANHKCGIEFAREYPDVHVVASDVSEDLYAGLDDEGLNVLFGIDQQSYLQGYLPFSFLTMAVTNNQMPVNDVIATGPHLVTESPSEEDVVCEANNFVVCDEEGGSAPPPTPPDEESPPSRSLMQTSEYGHQVTFAIGGFILAVGGYLLV